MMYMVVCMFLQFVRNEIYYGTYTKDIYVCNEEGPFN